MLIARDSIWEYQFFGDGNSDAPVDPFTETVPVTGWITGLAPFGFDGGADNFPQGVTINTEWPITSSIWIRRNVVTNGRDDMLVRGFVDDAAFFYVDGVYVGSVNPAATKSAKSYSLVLPKELLTEGTHQIAIMAIQVNPANGDEGTCVYMEGDYLPAMISRQPEAPITETLEWVTDVNTSKNGTEQRFQYRVSPVQSFELRYPADASRKQSFQNRMWGALTDEWLVPVWSQARYIGAVTADLLTVPLNTAEGEFRDLGLALLWESETNWQVLAIDQILSTSLLRTFNLTRAFNAAYLMPLRTAIIPDNVTKEILGLGYEAAFTAKFRVLDNAALTVTAPAQFLSEDVYPDEVLMAGDTGSDDIGKDMDIYNPGNGLLAHYQNWTNSQTSRTQRMVAEDAAEAWTMRQFLHRRAGRCKAFWQPSFEDDLRLLSTGNLTTTITVSDNDYERFAAGRTHIAIKQANGTWLYRTITAVLRTGSNTIQITLNSTLGIAASTVKRVCWLGLKRLNTDRVEIKYLGNGVSETQFRTQEIQP